MHNADWFDWYTERSIFTFISHYTSTKLTSTQTYGPFTVSYRQPSLASHPLSERARHLSRQGFGFLTSDPVRVVYQPKDDSNPTTTPTTELVDVPADGKTVGEIVMNGNITMKEYFRDPEATRKAFEGGYFHSGDLAVVHPDGYVAVQDRSKDIIISGGEVCVCVVHACVVWWCGFGADWFWFVCVECIEFGDRARFVSFVKSSMYDAQC